MATVYARPCAARLLGGALEDPTILRALRDDGVRAVDFIDSRVQAAYTLMCHLADGGRLQTPNDLGADDRSNTAAMNLRVISDWAGATVRGTRDDAHVQPADAKRRRSKHPADGVPSNKELLLEAAARLNIVWWVDLWENSWPPIPPAQRDLEALRRERARDALAALGERLCQRAHSRAAEPGEIVDDALERLHRIDPAAIARFMTGSHQGLTGRHAGAPGHDPAAPSVAAQASGLQQVRAALG